MKFILGSKSELKLQIVEKIIKEFVNQEAVLEGYDANSHVPDTPWDKETFDGAKNRAVNCKQHIKADFYLGLESGLIDRYGHIFEEAWVCLLDKEDNEYYGYSSGLKVPDYIINKMRNEGMSHSNVMKLIEDNGGIWKDTWGNYSGNMISRNISLEEALRNALIQCFSNDKSYFKK